SIATIVNSRQPSFHHDHVSSFPSMVCGRGSSLKLCSYCGRGGHTIDVCYAKHGTHQVTCDTQGGHSSMKSCRIYQCHHCIPSSKYCLIVTTKFCP
ncbi:hypothetical protein S245_067284, partial [Arachis hypogaea]